MAVEGVDAVRSLPESDRFRRLVAVAVSAVDVLDPESDLRQVAAAAGEIDVLVARVDTPGAVRTPSPSDAPDYPEPAGPVGSPGSALADDLLAAFAVPLHADEPPVEPRLPAGLHLHRLDLRWPVEEADEPDLVAALSELIGFDPEDEVFCVAPGGGPDGARDAEQTAVDRAVRRVARVYGLPVLHYRRVAGDAGGGAAPVAVAPAV